MNTRERGSASGVVIGVIAVVVLILAGLGIYAYKNPVDVASSGSNVATVSYPSSTTTIKYTVATTTTGTTYTSTASKPVVKVTQIASAYGSYSGGSAYRNTSYGLTVPGSYSVSQGQDIYGGVGDSASLRFYQGGVMAFQINAWSKESWSKLRNQETWNAHDGTGPTYYGEGTYLGENFVWIYTVVPGSYSPPSGITFYAAGSSAGSGPSIVTPPSYVSPSYVPPAAGTYYAPYTYTQTTSSGY